MSFILGAIMKVTGFFAISNDNKQTCFSDGYPKGTGANKQTYKQTNKQIARCINHYQENMKFDRIIGGFRTNIHANDVEFFSEEIIGSLKS